jgi:hypothetical protein
LNRENSENQELELVEKNPGFKGSLEICFKLYTKLLFGLLLKFCRLAKKSKKWHIF